VARLIGDVTVDECPSCIGVFIDADAISRIMAERQRSRAEAICGVYADSKRPAALNPGRMYIKCPQCATIMNRKQFARGAAVIVDVCRGHGSWFDAGELPVIIQFVMNGGLERAEKAEIADQREAARKARSDAVYAQMQANRTGTSTQTYQGTALADLFTAIWE
jgi:Zn-finger nucleic acid-binding protein